MWLVMSCAGRINHVFDASILFQVKYASCFVLFNILYVLCADFSMSYVQILSWLMWRFVNLACADLCMSYVQIYACVMSIAVQTSSLCFARLALIALHTYSVRIYIYIYIYIYICIYRWRRLILRGTAELRKADNLHNQKGSPKGVLKNIQGANYIKWNPPPFCTLVWRSYFKNKC